MRQLVLLGLDRSAAGTADIGSECCWDCIVVLLVQLRLDRSAARIASECGWDCIGVLLVLLVLDRSVADAAASGSECY
jgi:hypothetical protein